MFEKEKSLISSIDNQQIPNSWTFENIFEIFKTPFISFYFPWVVIVLIINRNNWKKPIIYILLFHYIFRSIGDLLRCFSNSMPVYKNRSSMWPYSSIRFYIGNIAALVFWIFGEIIGDWYPTVRACKIVHSKKKKILLRFSCIMYNLSKIMSIIGYIYYGRKLKFKNSTYEADSVIYDEILKKWWISVIFNLVFSFISDACVIYALKTEVFNKLKTLNGRSFGFVEKFKQISELRIIISMIISIVYMIILIPILIVKFKETNSPNKTVRNVFDQYRLNDIRETVIFFNHSMMYIDQILLKYISTFPSKKKPVLATIPDNTINKTTF